MLSASDLRSISFPSYSHYQAISRSDSNCSLSLNEGAPADQCVSSPGILDYTYGAISAFHFISNISSVVSKSKELLYGPVSEHRKRFWSSYVVGQLGFELVKDGASAVSNLMYIANALRETSWLKARLWSYNTLTCVASGFSLLGSCSEIVLHMRSLSLVNILLETNVSPMKKNSLFEHKELILISTANTVMNIALTTLLASAAVFGGNLLAGASTVVFLASLPLHFQAAQLEAAISANRYFHGSCCSVLK